MPAFPRRFPLAAACGLSGLLAAACAALAPDSLPPQSELTGTRWVASSIGGAPVAGRPPEIVFGAEDRLSGTGGCNRLFAVYEAARGFIDVRGLGRTEMACESETMRQEQAFVDVLQNAERYSREADRLVITDENGASVTLTASA
jgi:heat shock protein HslJ